MMLLLLVALVLVEITMNVMATMRTDSKSEHPRKHPYEQLGQMPNDNKPKSCTGKY